MSLPTPGSPRISKGTPGAARCAVPTRSRIRGVSRTVGTPVPPRADIFLPSLVRKEVRPSRAPSRANRPWGPKRPRMGVGELSGCRIDRSPERPTREQTGKLSDGQRLVNPNFFGLDTPFPASSAMRPAQRIILAWIYAGNHDASSIAVRENHTILDPLAPSGRHTVQFCDCGQRWKCGWRPAPPPRGTL